jgi:hypothetical protein
MARPDNNAKLAQSRQSPADKFMSFISIKCPTCYKSQNAWLTTAAKSKLKVRNSGKATLVMAFQRIDRSKHRINKADKYRTQSPQATMPNL